MQAGQFDVRSLTGGREPIWTPQPRQLIALMCPAFEVMFGGSKGGGKSDYLIFAPFRQIAVAHEKWKRTGIRTTGRAIIFRKNYKNLDELLARCEQYFPLIDPGVQMPTKDRRRFTFSCGYRFDLEHLDNPDSHKAYEGQQISFLGFDQVEEIALEQYNVLRAQVRSADPDLRPLLAVRSTSNPGGVHGAWVKERFVDPHPEGNKILVEEKRLRSGKVARTTRCYIPARLWDNKYLNDSYEASLRDLPEHLQKAYIDGDWEFVAGSMLGYLWRPELHIVEPKDYFEIPAHWTMRMGGDWGSTAPASVLFGTRDNDGRIWITDEIYGPGRSGSAFGERIQKYVDKRAQEASAVQRGHVWTLRNITGFLDPSAWGDHNGDGTSPAMTMQRMGIRWMKANNSRLAGLDQVKERLRIPDGGKRPRIFIFRRCMNLIRTLPNLPADPNNPEDIDTTAEDHAYDALRYLCMSWPIDAAKPENDERAHEWDEWEELTKKHRAEQQADTTGEIPTAGYD